MQVGGDGSRVRVALDSGRVDEFDGASVGSDGGGASRSGDRREEGSREQGCIGYTRMREDVHFVDRESDREQEQVRLDRLARAARTFELHRPRAASFNSLVRLWT